MGVWVYVGGQVGVWVGVGGCVLIITNPTL